MVVKKKETAKTKKTTGKSAKTGSPKDAEPAATPKGMRTGVASRSVRGAPKRAAPKLAPATGGGKTPERPAAPPPPHATDVIQVELKPSARTCPLVLDGIIVPEKFSPKDCFSCDEFDCRFYSAEERSSVLGSRLFADDERGGGFGDDEDDGGGGFYDEADADDEDEDDMR